MSPPVIFDDSLLAEHCLTARQGVRLRRLAEADAHAISAGLNDLDVAKNLVAVPHPYAVADAREFLSGPAAAPHMLCAAVEVDGVFAGTVAFDAAAGAPELGYWFAKDFWGRGVASLATRALVDLVFSATDLKTVVSGHFIDNEASAAVLAKLGFKRAGLVEKRSQARPEPTRLVTMTLDRESWALSQPAIETPRLVMRPPTMVDADEIAIVANDRGVALMTGTMTYPYRAANARAFVLNAARQGRPTSTSFSIRLKETGALVGGVGWKATEPGAFELGYWLGAEHRGIGIATEAARGALEAAFRLTDAQAATAICRVTNSASRGVLARCGFQWEGTGLVRSPMSSGSVAVDRFRLERDLFESLRSWGAGAQAEAV